MSTKSHRVNGGISQRSLIASRVCARGTHSGMQKQLEPIDLAKCVESSLHTSLDGFDLPRARLYGVSIVDADGVRSNHNGALRISFLAEHGDVYELLDAPSSAIARMFDAAVVLTCGWAAPIDRD
ncbi:MAG: hypothetical protein ACKOAQ_08855, partial [Acidimicrobiaceae bacterium]